MGFLAEHVRSSAADPDGLLGVLATTPVGDRLLDEGEVIGFLLTLLVAGNETTRTLVSGGAEALARHPDQQALLAGDPSLLARAVEEMLRWVTPIQAFGRTAVVDVELAGTPVPAGTFLVMLYASANRDEAAFGPDAGTSTSGARPPRPTWPSGSASTAAWGRAWPGWRPGCSSRSCSPATPGSGWPASRPTPCRHW